MKLNYTEFHQKSGTQLDARIRLVNNFKEIDDSELQNIETELSKNSLPTI